MARTLRWLGCWLGVLLLLTACGGKSGSTTPKGFQEFRDTDERFSVLYADNWTFQPGPDAGVKLSDPSDPSYQLTVTVGPVPRSLGATAIDLNPDLLALMKQKPQKGLPIPSIDRGVLVEKVTPNSAAGKGGLQVGDVITGVDSQPALDSFAVQIAVGKHKAGETMAFTVHRGSTNQTLKILAPKLEVLSVKQFNRTALGQQIGISLAEGDTKKTVVEQRNASEKTDKKQRIYYTYELVIATEGRARHVMVSVVVDQGFLYTMIAGCSDDTWPAHAEKIKTMTGSFQLLPAA